MNLRRLIEVSILIIEDEEIKLTANHNYIKALEKDCDRLKQAGIAKFRIDKANSLEKAIELLTQNIQTPYNIVLLDLMLPEPSTSQFDTGSYIKQSDGKFRGFRILEFIKKTGAAEAVIVVSAFGLSENNMLKVFRGGGFDFIEKPFLAEELQERILICWSRLLLEKSNRIIEGRIGDLVPYAEKGLAHRFTTCFSELVQSVTHGTEDMERYVHERYGLSRQKDSQDFFFKCLKWQEDSVAKARKEWEDLQTSLRSNDELSKSESVETLIEETNERLLPCFIVKRVELEVSGESSVKVLTFDDDVRAVLREVISGSLDRLHDYDEGKKKISVKVESVDEQARVSILDQLERISPRDARDINEGSNISPDRRFGREWGLSVVQHIAMRGGGRLEVKPQSKGNLVTYFIPLAN